MELLPFVNIDIPIKNPTNFQIEYGQYWMQHINTNSKCNILQNF